MAMLARISETSFSLRALIYAVLHGRSRKERVRKEAWRKHGTGRVEIAEVKDITIEEAFDEAVKGAQAIAHGFHNALGERPQQGHNGHCRNSKIHPRFLPQRVKYHKRRLGRRYRMTISCTCYNP